MDIRRQVAMSIYESIGGDPNKHFDTVEDIYDEIETIYKSQDYRLDVESLHIYIDKNGSYIFDSRDVQGYKPVSVEVEVAGGEGGDYNTGYEDGMRDGIEEQKSKLETIQITQNGNYTNENGYKEVNVSVEGGDSKPKIYNGFMFMCEGPNDYQYFKDLDFSQYDWSNVYNLTYFFRGFRSNNPEYGLKASDFNNFIENFNGKILSMRCMFDGSSIIEAPDFGNLTGDCMDMSWLFTNHTELKDVSNLSNWNTDNLIDMSFMFSNCPSLTNIPLFNTNLVEDMSQSFEYCSNLTQIPDFDTSSLLRMDYTFHNCTSLTSVPNLNTKNVLSFRETFGECENLTDTSNLQYWDFRNASDLTYMFHNCQSITEIPHLQNTGLVKWIDCTFKNCHMLEVAPEMDWSGIRTISDPFNGCQSLRSMPLYNTENVGNMLRLGWNLNNLTDLEGFMNLGKCEDFTCFDFLNDAPNLTRESLVKVIDNLFDRRYAGYHDVDINFGSQNLAKLSDEELTRAINKGYNLI